MTPGPGPSDIRLKENITKVGVTNDGINLYRYRFIGEETYEIGVIAQEVQEIIPSAVFTGDDGYLRVDYGQILK